MTIIIDRWQHLLTTHVRTTRTTFLYFCTRPSNLPHWPWKTDGRFRLRGAKPIRSSSPGSFPSTPSTSFCSSSFPPSCFPLGRWTGMEKKREEKKKKSKRRKSVLDHGRRVVGKPKKRANLFFQREDTRTDWKCGLKGM